MLLCPVNCGKEKRRHNVGCHVCSEVWVWALIQSKAIRWFQCYTMKRSLFSITYFDQMHFIVSNHCFSNRHVTSLLRRRSVQREAWKRKKENIGRNNIWIKQCNRLRQSTRGRVSAITEAQHQGCTKNSWLDNKIQVKQKGRSQQARRRKTTRAHKTSR